MTMPSTIVNMPNIVNGPVKEEPLGIVGFAYVRMKLDVECSNHRLLMNMREQLFKQVYLL